MEKLSSHISRKEIDLLSEKPSTKKSSGPDDFADKFYQKFLSNI